ncbi:hypothetical protein QL285_090987 [Trifolium repens]|nr:hypothetical protein QL285_090987 [Trifolium repens]
MISMFPGGYRSFFSDAFPSIHHGNTPPPPPPPPPPACADFTYAVDIFFQGEQEREHLYTNIVYQDINIKTCPNPAYFELHASNWVDSNLNFIEVKKDGCEEYLIEKLRLSCVLISSRYDLTPDRAWGLFSSSCKPVVSVTINKRWVEAVYETVMPGLCKTKTEMVKFKVKVKCGWKGGEEHRFYVKSIEFRMEDMNGKSLKEEYAARVLLNAVENGERKRKK